MVDEDGFDFMKISFLRDIKAQQRSLRFVFIIMILWSYCSLFVMYSDHTLKFAETTQKHMPVQNTMTKQNLGMKGVILHFLVHPKMKLINLMPLIW